MPNPWKCGNCGTVNLTPLKPLPHCAGCGLLIGPEKFMNDPEPEPDTTPDLTDAERREVEER